MHRILRRASAAFAAPAAGYVWCKEPEKPMQRKITAVADITIEAQLFQPEVPYPQWSYNWDHRDFDSNGVRRKPGRAAAQGAKRRHILLVRHGQYREKYVDDAERILTPLGRAQAAATGQRVAEIVTQPGAVCRAIFSSNMARAVETADIVARSLPGVRRAVDPSLAEGVPCHAIPGGVHHTAAVYRDGARIEASFRRYFKRSLPYDETDDDDDDDEFASPGAFSPPRPGDPTDEYDVIVCHANVIRFFCLRALQLPPEAWLRLCTMNCSITYVTIGPSGHVSLRMMGDVGHLKPDQVTFGELVGFNW
mmetsp:Transcript_14503/g.43313  ORF Transcript_14503/g.43313 Transcript_14503/m.43313 type:complete len:308 (+) Transcript_14503:225-1148(+)